MKRCNDPRCLNTNGQENLPEGKFRTVTTRTREGSGLWEKCDHCNLVINRTGVEKDEASDYYNKEYQEKNSFVSGASVSPREHFEIRLDSIKTRIPYLETITKQGDTVLELGAGTGELLYLLREQVEANYLANEINEDFVAFINSDLGILAEADDYLSRVYGEPIDLVISVGTIDHIYETGEIVQKVYDDLKAGGKFYVEVPNDNQALNANLSGPYASMFTEWMYQKAHYYSFSEETLTQFLVSRGFVVEDVFTRHDYTVLNYLSWYLTGRPQKNIFDSKGKCAIHSGQDSFDEEMDELLTHTNESFRAIINKHMKGEMLCVLARKPE